MSKVRQKMKASKKANELISSALWVASCGLGNGAKYNTARQNLEDYIAELEREVTVRKEHATKLLENIEKLDAIGQRQFSRIAELEAESERFTVHSDIERQDDKSPNDTQTQKFVYGKEREE